MAKKKRRTQQPQQHRWLPGEEAMLLAWLDHSIAHAEVDFYGTIVSRLKSVYTITQIERKLFGLWRSYGPHHEEHKPRLWKSDLFTHGSECLKRTNHEEHGLPEEMLRELTAWTKVFEEEYATKQLLPIGHNLRSKSSSNDYSPVRRTGLNSPKFRIQTPQAPQQRAQSYSTTPAAIKREIESPFGKKSQAKKRRHHLPQNVCVSMTGYI